jgi:hypothetical protein
MSKKQPRKEQRTETQHYVPQMYLRGFTNGSGRMFCYDKATGKSYLTSTQAAAQEPNFYEVRPVPGLNVPLNAVEKALGVVESTWAPMLADLIKSADAGGITPRQVIDFAPFVVIQWMRTPTFRAIGYEILRRYGQSLVDQLVDLNFPDMAGKIKFCLEQEGMAGVHAEELFDKAKVERMARELAQHLWVIGINETEHSFYTSDHPIVRRGNQHVNDRPLIGPNDPGIEFTFPLDNRHILVILERTHFAVFSQFDRRSVPLPPEMIRDYNELQVLRSNQRIYCANDDFDRAREVCTAQPEICDPKRLRVVVETTPIVDMSSETWVRVLE